MSARLISNKAGHCGKHDHHDDLESSIYVLLLITLMYSKCSYPSHVSAFMAGVLDPQPIGPTGGFGKTDLLIARSF
jgi:hypothetical protein